MRACLSLSLSPSLPLSLTVFRFLSFFLSLSLSFSLQSTLAHAYIFAQKMEALHVLGLLGSNNTFLVILDHVNAVTAFSVSLALSPSLFILTEKMEAPRVVGLLGSLLQGFVRR